VNTLAGNVNYEILSVGKKVEPTQPAETELINPSVEDLQQTLINLDFTDQISAGADADEGYRADQDMDQAESDVQESKGADQDKPAE
jgi:hypothetical protein